MPRGHVLPDGQTIATLRGEAGLTQDELAVRAGYGLRTIGKIESSRPTTSPTLSAVATVLSNSLGRNVELGDLLVRGMMGVPMFEPRAPQRDVFVGDHVQWLDFTDYSALPESASPPKSTTPESAWHGGQRLRAPSAVLNETILVRHIPPTLESFDLSYDARGGAALGRSLSHADGAVWSSSDWSSPTGSSRAELRIPIVDASCVPPFVLQNRIEYFDETYFDDAFADATVRTDASPVREKLETSEKFETRVTHPTDCLTLIVSLPFCRGAQELQAFCLQDEQKLQPAPQPPLLLSHGHVIVWRIASPRPGQTYQLRWR